MPQMNPSNARVIDPILTEVARGYRSNASPVANILFPVVDVGQRGGKIIVYTPEDFKILNTARAPGANTKRVQFSYGSTNYSLVDYSLEAAVPVELQQEAGAVPGLDLAAQSVRKVRNLQALEKESQAAALATTAGNYGAGNKITLTGTDQWSDPASDPHGDIETGKEAIRSQTGVRPNVLTLAPKVLSALRVHPKVLDKISTSKDRTPATLAQLAAQFEVDQVVEAGAITHNGTAFVDLWGTYAHLAYTVTATAADLGAPTFGYTYQLMGMPMVEEGYYDRNTKTWYYPVTDARQPVLAGATAGFLFIGAVA
jgi:hypothetical protein